MLATMVSGRKVDVTPEEAEREGAESVDGVAIAARTVGRIVARTAPRIAVEIGEKNENAVADRVLAGTEPRSPKSRAPSPTSLR